MPYLAILVHAIEHRAVHVADLAHIESAQLIQVVLSIPRRDVAQEVDVICIF